MPQTIDCYLNRVTQARAMYEQGEGFALLPFRPDDRGHYDGEAVPRRAELADGYSIRENQIGEPMIYADGDDSGGRTLTEAMFTGIARILPAEGPADRRM